MRPCFLASLLGVAIARAESITLYGNAEQPPKSYLDGGMPKGFAIEAAVAVVKRAGYDVVTVTLLPPRGPCNRPPRAAS